MTSPREEATTIDAAAKPRDGFRHTEAALDRLSIRRLIANEPLDLDDVLDGLETDSRTGTMREIVERLHSRSLDDRQFSIKLSVLARPDMITPKDKLNVTGLQINLAGIILRTYEDWKKVQKKPSREQYRNGLSLLGEFYHRYNATDASFLQMDAALIAWLGDLLSDTEEEDVELVARQLSINGQLLSRCAETKLNELVRRVKQQLVQRNLSVKSRTLLMYVIDLANRDFAPLLGEQRDFYVGQLGEATFADFEFCGRHVQQQPPTTFSRSVLVSLHPQSHFKPVCSDRSKPPSSTCKYEPSKPIVVPRPKPIIQRTTTTTTEDTFDRFAKSTYDALPRTSRRGGGCQAAAAAPHCRKNQRSGQCNDHHKAERSRRNCKNSDKDRKPTRHSPPVAAAAAAPQQQRLDRYRPLPPPNGDHSSNDYPRDEATATITTITTTTTTTTTTTAKDDENVSFSWADDLPDEEDEAFVETPDWYKKSSGEPSRGGKETKSGDSCRRRG
ncbi:uncharacterized protein LOC106656096 isoform X2 [Trichogramma pretiosum]|uniref:uncharacterized protein LOC106656096 isoform X2 n=1 Tax=Trichogramma pretiosum TaxID=7493 RepID=UPI000C71A374|nr:uncharacterized protein LOC106656096 isoform X2 [Trichogramma pretiosum]